MATRIKPRDKSLYEEDFYVWAETQARLLRDRRFDQLDLANLIEEVDDLGGVLKRSVRSRARTIMEHLLRLQHSPATDPRPVWRETVRTLRTRLATDLTPNLRRSLADELPDLYTRARHDAEASLRDHGEHAAADALPATCPYTPDHRQLVAVDRRRCKTGRPRPAPRRASLGLQRWLSIVRHVAQNPHGG